MRRGLLLLALVLTGSAPAWAQQPSVNYSVSIESPGSVALGTVSLRVRVSGGVQEPQGAAYHLRSSGAWSEAQSVRLPRIGEGLYGTEIDTTDMPNDGYRIEVRVWSDVPPYEPGDQRTFSRAALDLAVDNPPPTPQGVEGLTPATSIRLGWRAVDTAERDDFGGYRVLLRRGKTCPTDPGAYRAYESDGLLFTQEKLAPGDYCARVAAVRTSALTDVVLSAPSAPVRISISKGDDPLIKGDGILIETTEEVAPPPPPPLGEAEEIVSDGEFIEDLPYGSQTVTQAADEPGSEEQAALTLEAGHDPKRTPILIAAGLILAALAAQIRRFLASAPKP